MVSASADLTPKYRLPRHVYVSAGNDGAIFLDLRRDKYFGLGCEQQNALSQLVVDWPQLESTARANSRTTADEAKSAADALVAEGLLTLDPASGKSATPIKLTDAPSLLALGDQVESYRPVAIADVANFICAYSQASLAMRFRPLEAVIAHVVRRKARDEGAAPTFDPGTVAMHVAVFKQLRAFFFTSRNRCLLHALVLVNFLARYRVYPQLVIGVKMQPFGAHSWVQHDRFVLDATPEEVGFYTPILAA